MSTTVTITGGSFYQGVEAEITAFTATEDATPIVPGDSFGGTSQITFTALDDARRNGALALAGNRVLLQNSDYGNLDGDIESMSGGDRLVSVTANGLLRRLVINVSAQPFNGNFSGAAAYYVGLAGGGLTVYVDPSLASQAVVAMGWRDQDLWTKLKEFAVAYGAVIKQVGTQVQFLPRDTTVFKLSNVGSTNWQVNATQQAQNVEVAYYNTSYGTRLVHPDGGWTQETPIYSVDAGEENIVNIPVPMWVVSVEQPVPLEFMDKKYSSPSAYTVTAADGKNVMPAQWNDSGGKVSVAIGEDGTSLDVTIKGPMGSLAERGPFSLALTASNGTSYSTLRLRATGVYFNQESVKISTGADPYYNQDVGTTVENPFIRTKAQALAAAQGVSQQWGAPRTSISVKSPNPKPGSAILNTLPGQRFQWRRAMYRVTSVTVSENGVDLQADQHTTIADINASAAGKTFAQINTLNAGMTFRDLTMAPLPVAPEDYDRY